MKCPICKEDAAEPLRKGFAFCRNCEELLVTKPVGTGDWDGMDPTEVFQLGQAVGRILIENETRRAMRASPPPSQVKPSKGKR